MGDGVSGQKSWPTFGVSKNVPKPRWQGFPGDLDCRRYGQRGARRTTDIGTWRFPRAPFRPWRQTVEICCARWLPSVLEMCCARVPARYRPVLPRVQASTLIRLRVAATGDACWPVQRYPTRGARALVRGGAEKGAGTRAGMEACRARAAAAWAATAAAWAATASAAATRGWHARR